jgi:hypothetical protein
MIYVFNGEMNVYGWNTGMRMKLEKGVELSDYTELEEEFDEKTLKETFEWVDERNKKLNMKIPSLMMVTTGFSKSCRVWADLALLIPLPHVKDPKEGFEYYYEME